MESSSSVLGDVGQIPEAMQSKQSKTVEEMYQKKTQREHILLRPDAYTGSDQLETNLMYVWDEGIGMVYRNVTYVPALLKIYDELVVNAADNKQRDSSMSTIRIDINPELNEISVWNDGRGVPVVMHNKENMYVPELIFGHLLTSSNYDDSEKKVTGGRNGYGAKLCNIFSTKFTVETADSQTGKSFKQVFSKNMSERTEPVIKASNKNFTKITFEPDLSRFGMENLDADTVALLTRRAYDLAGVVPGVKVYFNGIRLPIKNFLEYCKLFINESESSMPIAPIHERINERWEVVFTLSENSFQQMSFVNSIATTKGGKHVDYIVDQITSKLVDVVAKKNKDVPVKAVQVKNHLRIFVNCLIENPAFDSQTKENMTLAKRKFGSTATLSEKFIKSVAKSGIIDLILNWAKFKSQSVLAKGCSAAKKIRVSNIPKLDDANEAGGRKSQQCTLILTEGDSAKALAVGGLSVVGRDFYGVFPLRGKLLNVRDVSTKQIVDNVEISNIIKIMGLQFKKEYTDTKTLRYGHLMIMTDQDHDGSHIKGLLINFLHFFWPSLLHIPGFLVEFITPIVKVTKSKLEYSFYTLPEYESWREETDGGHGWKIKYYKGLGTNTPKEAKQYFSQMESHQLSFAYSDGGTDDNDITMAFSKKAADQRKEWLANFKPGTFLDHSIKEIEYSNFINNELILFSLADNMRSIPSMMDGLKPGQRKILFSCFKRNLKDEIKVAQLSGYVAEHSAYHHGEASLSSTIINMAQTFVGSNNINLLEPCGQFGTRLQGGKDAASPRYVFTKLSPLARTIFHPDDDNLFEFLEDDGQRIEPNWYLPIIPMVLVNGSDGIGTGWSSSVPNFNPRDIVKNILLLMDGEDQEQLAPWYRDFAGKILPVKPDDYTRFACYGTLTEVDDITIEITELPVRHWVQAYKEFLETLVEKQIIREYREYHTDTRVHFVITLSSAETMADLKKTGLMKYFKMTGSFATTNMVLFDSQCRLRKFSHVNEIISDFYDTRLEYYKKRKAFLTDRLTDEWTMLDNKMRFICAVIDGTLIISNRKKAELLVELKELGYRAFKGKSSITSDNEEGSGNGYDYLLSMPLWNLTLEKVQKLMAEKDAKEAELNVLLGRSPTNLWRSDLECFLSALDDDEVRKKEEEAVIKKPRKNKKGNDDDDDYRPKAKPKKKMISAPKTIPSGKKVVLNVSNGVASIAKKVSSNVPEVSATVPPAPVGDDVTSVPVHDNIAFAQAADDDDIFESESNSLEARISKKKTAVHPRSPGFNIGASSSMLNVKKRKLLSQRDQRSLMLNDDDFIDSIADDVIKPIPGVSSTGESSEKVFSINSGSDDDDDLFAPNDVNEKSLPKSKTVAASKKKAASKPKATAINSGSDDDDLFAPNDVNEKSLPKSKTVAASRKKAASKPKAAAKAKVVGSKKGGATATLVDGNTSLEENNEQENVPPITKTVSVVKKAAKITKEKKAAPTRRKKNVVSESEDEDIVAPTERTVTVTQGRSRRTAASKNVCYNFSDGSDDDEDEPVKKKSKIDSDSCHEEYTVSDSSDSDAEMYN